MSAPRLARLAIACGALILCGAGRSKDADVQLRFGVDMAEKGAWKEAEYRFRRALDLAPGDARVLNNLAVACENNGRYEEAEKAYVQALESAPNDRGIRDNFERFRVFYAEHLQKRPDEATPSASQTRPADPS